MGNTTYSFNSSRIQIAASNQEILYYAFRGYAYINGVQLYPFNEGSYLFFSDIFGALDVESCNNCITAEFSISKLDSFGTTTYAILGNKINAPLLYNQSNKYKLDTINNTITTPLCITDDFPINFYYNSIDFGNTTYKDWSYSKGDTCRLIYNLPGYDFTSMLSLFSNNIEYDAIQNVIGYGNKLVLTKDSWNDDNSLLVYCLGLTDYTDYHCNGVMFNYCLSNNYSNNKCVAWMDGTVKQGNTIGLDLYLPYCQGKLNTNECSYFSQTSLSYNTYYRDQAIKYYCDNNSDSNCNCTNSNIIANNLITSYLGPKTCWLAGCTSKNIDDKYILTEDLNTRKNCKLNACSISIGNLELTSDSSANINIINQCLEQVNVKQIVGNNQNNRFEYSEILFSTALIYIIPFLLFTVLIIFIEFFIKKNMYNQTLKSPINSTNTILKNN